MRKLFLQLAIASLFCLGLSESIFAQWAGGPWNTGGRYGTAASSWVPTDDPTLNLWLRADDLGGLDSSVVSGVWPDTSGNGFDATPSGGPYLIKNALNGHSVVRFDGSGDYFSGTTDTLQQFSFYAVYNTNTDGTYHGFYTQIKTSPYKGWNIHDHATFNQTAATGGTGNTIIAKTGTAGSKPFHIRTFIATTDSVKSFIDGSDAGSGAKDIIYADTNYRIGRYYTAATTFELIGDVAEILIFAKSHSATEQAQVEAYLTAKYFPDQSVPMDSLQLWLVADDISGVDSSAITQKWPDRSYYFDRKIVPYSGPKILTNDLNGHRTVSFNSSYFLTQGVTDSIKIFDNFTFIVVVKATNTGLAGIMTISNATPSTGGLYMKYGTLGLRFLPSGNYTNTAINADNTWKILTFQSNSVAPKHEIYQDGTQVLLNTTEARGSGAPGQLAIGRFYVGTSSTSYPLVGDIAEILFYSKYLTTAERQAIESYLNSRYSVY